VHAWVSHTRAEAQRNSNFIPDVGEW